MITLISSLLLWLGSLLMLIGTIGLWYKKHFMEKLHLLTISDTIGMLLFLMGVSLRFHDIWKSIFLLILYSILGPMTSHILARAFYLRKG